VKYPPIIARRSCEMVRSDVLCDAVVDSGGDISVSGGVIGELVISDMRSV
jgi:hypothetical protein